MKKERQVFHSILSNGIKGGNWDLPSPGCLLWKPDRSCLASLWLLCSADRFICCDDGTIPVKRIKFKLPDILSLGGLLYACNGLQKTERASKYYCKKHIWLKTYCLKYRLILYVNSFGGLQKAGFVLCRAATLYANGKGIWWWYIHSTNVTMQGNRNLVCM